MSFYFKVRMTISIIYTEYLSKDSYNKILCYIYLTSIDLISNSKKKYLI